MKASEIRSTFLKFFESKGHQIVGSSPVVPGDDPTLLFTNAGMNQFKDVFLGFDKRPYSRATTSQKCIRAGGKHNDLDNVGYTARHHTFFEMLGNFSFGDYFKHDAISYAWELLTEHFKLPKDKLWVTVYSEDDEAYEIWNKVVGVPAERIVRIGDNKGARYMSDNFWMMGDTGPCGPCTEIFFDHGEGIPGGPPGSPDEDGDRYIEIWNNVFMQFNRTEDGVMHKLPKPSVDTGMGLERITAVLQHVHSNYEIDLFVALLAAAKAAVESAGGKDVDPESPSLKVIADHIRACSFTIVDGVIPGNEGRGYVLRRIARRAIRHGYKLGARTPFFHKIVAELVAQMGEAYPELRAAQARVTEVLKQEEERFFQTIQHGMEILEHALAGGTKQVDGETAFKLHDTYGFPVDLTADVCRERGVTVDQAGFDAAMEHQRSQARAAGKFKMAAGLAYSGAPTAFHGYEHLVCETSKVVAIYVDGTPVDAAQAGDDAAIVLDHTPFYAESGGQAGDSGELRNGSTRVVVADTFKIQADVFGHHGRIVEGSVKVGDSFVAKVDAELRAKTVRNHSATHLMHKALREVLGAHVQQKGSLVNAERTRFDFAHNAPVSDAQIRQVEAIVNAEILANAAASAQVMALDDAQKSGAMMLFGEKYGETVRVLSIGSSKELCGGTHVKATGDIGLFKVVAESGVAAGIRRIEAITGDNALAYLQSLESTVNGVASALKSAVPEVPARISGLQDQVRALEKELAALKGKLASSQGDSLLAQTVDINGLKVLAVVLEGADAATLRTTMDQLKNKLKTAAIVLAAVDGGKVQLAAGVTADSTAKVKAGELVNFVAQQVGGKGGGKPDMAMAGGTDPSKLAAALASVPGWVGERV
ncbi:alanyl-tRNA synthetase [Leptothrix cholodnii SP-6]|uniref:Alanine--tRNA ligase n=1 Tax=Leptothrix cholodnii (strain ATCC 51168 / LMG 8142 / SP-6) TaxID=395495 RepID=SYA_LEPCP|nr:alanine--tRNA ligase [Leptothrix cholodnii]B1Y1G9.1 RecName: Full=Alanine--tRNA ligase; AltName: Full=Alanyl-tRNA synthetase; Short=AlaRS [Leptothrix cholodnii SP-6]ACB34268.1 alanyl-tRNA synthetase [Leptothrix cholodnii SP-6]